MLKKNNIITNPNISECCDYNFETDECNSNLSVYISKEETIEQTNNIKETSLEIITDQTYLIKDSSQEITNKQNDIIKDTGNTIENSQEAKNSQTLNPETETDDSNSEKTSTFNQSTKSSSKKSTGVIIGIIIGVVVLIAIIITIIIIRKKRKKTKEEDDTHERVNTSTSLEGEPIELIFRTTKEEDVEITINNEKTFQELINLFFKKINRNIILVIDPEEKIGFIT